MVTQYPSVEKGKGLWCLVSRTVEKGRYDRDRLTSLEVGYEIGYGMVTQYPSVEKGKGLWYLISFIEEKGKDYGAYYPLQWRKLKIYGSQYPSLWRKAKV